MLAIVCGSVGTGFLLLLVAIVIVRSHCLVVAGDEDEEHYLTEEESLLASKKLGISKASSYNISSNQTPNNKLKNHYMNNHDRRQSQTLIQNPIHHPPKSLYNKAKVPDNPHVTIHNNLKSAGTEI